MYNITSNFAQDLFIKYNDLSLTSNLINQFLVYYLTSEVLSPQLATFSFLNLFSSDSVDAHTLRVRIVIL